MYTKRDAAQTLGIDRNTLDKWLLVCNIIPKRDPRDTRLRLLSEDDLLTLREHYAESHRAFNGASVHPYTSSADLEARVAALEQQVAALLSRSAANLTPPIHSTVYEPPRRASASTVRHTRTPARPPLPAYLMSIPTWVERHDMKEGTVKHWRDVGKLPVERGQWLEGMVRIDTALTIEGRETAHQLAHLPWPCEVCAGDGEGNEAPHIRVEM